MPKNPLAFELIPVVDLTTMDSFDCEAIQSHFSLWGSESAHRIYRPKPDVDSGFPEDVQCAIAWLFKHIPDEHKSVVVVY